MPVRIPYTPVDIIIEIPDRIINDTILKRKAHLFTMTYNQHAEYLTLTWVIKYYADLDGEFGDSLSFMIPDYSKNTIADNTTFVDPSTGTILTSTPILTDIHTPTLNPVSGDMEDVVTQEMVDTFPMDYMGQYDFFNMMAENYPLQVHDMIRQYGNNVSTWDIL